VREGRAAALKDEEPEWRPESAVLADLSVSDRALVERTMAFIGKRGIEWCWRIAIAETPGIYRWTFWDAALRPRFIGMLEEAVNAGRRDSPSHPAIPLQPGSTMVAEMFWTLGAAERELESWDCPEGRAKLRKIVDAGRSQDFFADLNEARMRR